MRLGILLLLLSAPLLAQKRAITFDDYIALKAVSDAQLSPDGKWVAYRSEEHTSELQSPCNLVCRLLLEKKNKCHITKEHFHKITSDEEHLTSQTAAAPSSTLSQLLIHNAVDATFHFDYAHPTDA